MTVTEFLAMLQNQGIKFRVEGDRLRYRGPAAKLTPEVHAAIAERKTELLAALQQEHMAEHAGPRPMARDRLIPVSFAQQRLWFLDQLQPNSAAYNISSTLSLSGPIDVAMLERSFTALVARHEILRTTFGVVEEQPVQRIAAAKPLPMPVHDFQTLPPAEQLAAVRRIISDEAQQPFDLQRGPLLRVVLLRLEPAEHVLIVTMHHIISDGWSIAIFIRELTALYAAGGVGLPPLPVQYADYCVWQRQRLQGPHLDRLLDYWRRQLQDAPAFLDFPTDRTRPKMQTFSGATITATLDATLTAGLKSLSRQAGATLFMTLLTVFQVLLARHSAQEDVVVGTPIAGRTHKQLADLIGFFVNTLALRTDLGGNPAFLELLERVRAMALDAFAHQELPFEQLIDALHPTRDLSRLPLVQVMFAMQNMPTEALELPGLVLQPVPVENTVAKFDLTLTASEEQAELRLELEYNTDLFEAATITRLIEHYQVLLAAIVADPRRRIDRLPLLTDAERHTLLVEWNQATLDYPTTGGIHTLVEAQARRTPDAVAVVAGAETISYAELNRRANQLAHHLCEQGVGRESCVGIAMEPSIAIIEAMLGVFKAGGAYVPFDPAYPQERLRWLLADSQVTLLLTEQRHVDHLPATDVPILCLDHDWPQIAVRPTTDPGVAVSPDNLAYMIYTSGSTGLPKGTLLAHRGVLNNLHWRQQQWPLTGEDRVLLNYAVSFDPSLWSIFWPLSAGAQLVTIGQDVRYDSAALVRTMAEQRISVYGGSPSQHAVLLGEPEITACTSLRYVVAGGEQLSRELQQQFHATLPALLCNCYGPTEATIDTTYWICPREATPPTGVIGRPLPNVQVYLLDRHGQPVPIGVPGELYIGGVGLARGYYQRPDLTATQFVPDSFGGEPGERLYRTGDLACYRADGTLEFLGRIDDQVKLRGFRIELGEIEALLMASPLVREAAVLLREDEPGAKRLVAYVVGEQENKPVGARRAVPDQENNELEAKQKLVAALRSQIAAALPEYMVPTAFVILDKLPLTTSGKLDRRALPRPSDDHAELASSYVAPATELERTVAEIWQALLKVEQIGVHDNFFERGGHSLLATQVVSRVRDAVQVELPLHTLFEKPTIAGMSERIEAARRNAQHSTLPPLQRVPRDGRLPLSFAQQRLWFLDQLEPGNPFYNIHAALDVVGRLDVGAVEHSLNTLIVRHESLRTTFAMLDNQPVQVIAPAWQIALPIIDLEDLPVADREAEALRQAAEEAGRPFDLQHGPLLRVKLLRLDQNRHSLLLTIHHIISDGWSMGVLVRELFALYTAYAGVSTKQSATTLATLPPLPIQYADFAVWQRQWLTGAVLEQQLGYWKRRLADLPVLELPTDRPRPPVLSFRGATQAFTLPRELSAALLLLSHQADATLFMTTLAALQIVLARYTGQSDIAVGSAIANRTRIELESLIGFFVNMLVLRTDLSGAPTVRHLLAQVRDVSLSAYAHQDLPFEQLVEELQPERSLSYNPLFQVGFALQNMPLELTDLPELELRPLNVVTRSSTFDLSLFLQEGPDGIGGMLEYNTDLFDATTIDRMIGHFHTVLAAMAADPDQSVMALPLLTEPEQQQLAAWNDTAADAEQRWAHELWEAQATRTPDATALVFEDTAGRIEQLSYAELNRRANQLGHHLRSLGAAPGVLVGLCVERSPELVIGLLAILKAGAAYVPLDPEYPGERLQFMLQDAAVAILVTQQHLPAQLSAPAVVCLDRDQAAIDAWPERNLGLALPAHTLAYVIYTSGSTGQPKGVMVEHQQLANTLFASQKAFSFSAADRMPCIASFSFDIALFELLCPLLAGGSAMLMTKQQILDLPGFARTLEAVTVLHTLPSLMRQVVGFIREHDLRGRYRALRQVFVGGDAVAPDLLAEIRDAFPDARINVLYGPTEATIICATHAVADQILNKHLIGKPLSNSLLRLYDRQQQPVPVGVPGELYIAGRGVTRGYLDRPELTAEKYVELDRQRWYRSGDLARYLPDGTLEFLGRIDQQVKIRGFRLELGEIEAVLNEHPDIREAAVVPRTDRPGDPRLVGYVVPAAVAPGAVAQSSYVDDWQLLYDETYSEGQATDPAFNIVGWHSSYTGAPFPPAEMREWRDATVERIRALHPQRILEIGCGTGLLLFPLAGACVRYHGIDFSAPALAHIQRHLPPAWTHVTLAQQRADELTDLLPGSFDTVIINSVAQYFPSVEYLAEVIERSIRLLAPGGHLFVGDVRSRPLLDAFATAVTLAQAAPDTSREALLAQVRQQVVQERELLLDPDFFHALRQAQPRISAVQVEIKRGQAQNELTQFRYDVTLTVDGLALLSPPPVEYDWSVQRWTLEDLQAALQAGRADTVLVRGIPSARVQPLVQAVNWLHDATGPTSAGELRAAIDRLHGAAVEPEAIWALAIDLGYRTRLGWSENGATGCFDAVFSRSEAARLPEPSMQPLQPWSAYATAPAATRATAEIAPRLRQYLQARLPEYMIPAAFVALEALPLTPNGKVDRAALPAPFWNDAAATADAQPRTPIEAMLAEIWQQVLGLPAVGIHANFFALGGHSLLATQVISRIRAGFGLDLPVRALFEYPTIAELSTAVTEAQQTLNAAPELPPLTRRTHADPAPLSFAQQRLWFIEQLQPGVAGYHVSAAWNIHGALDLDALQASLDVVVARHESLRTTFVVMDEQPVQRIAPPQSLPIPLVDLSALQAHDQARELEQQVRSAMSTPFDLARGPLVRPVLLRRDRQSHVFVLVLHHIITDGWSMGVMIGEIAAMYIAAVRGQSVELPTLSVQYADYAVWQRSRLAPDAPGAILERQLAYWRKQLGPGGTPVVPLQLPTDHPRPALPSQRGAAVPIAVDGALLDQLRDLSRRTGTTLFMIFLAAWQLLLARYSGQDDIAVGTPIAGRTQPELEPLIGFFVNTLVLRARLAGNPTFGELLADVRATTLDGFAHQDAPFEAVVEALNPERDPSWQPLFQVMFALSNTTLPDIHLPEIRITPVDQPPTASVFDLTLLLFDTPSGVTGSVEYAVDLFEAATIERMAGHFQMLLAGIVANPDARVAALPLLTDYEQQILHEWHQSAADDCHHVTVHQLIEAQAARTPHAVAVVFGDQTLTYAALNSRANRLAHTLIAQGVGPDVLVGVCVERSLEMIVAVIAILKAGGAYLPLDPAYPAQRLQTVLADADVPLLMTQQRLLTQIRPGKARVICLDHDWPGIAKQPDTNPARWIAPENLAYVIYTSGSTGTPKGVLVAQRGLSNLVQAHIAAFGIGPASRVLQFASLSFDASAAEIFTALAAGASLHLVARETILSLPDLVQLLQTQAITVATLPPSLLALLPTAELTSLETVIAAGERCPAALARQWQAAAGERRFINAYGPTETTIGPTYHEASPLPANAVTVPIGRPIANVQLYILDQRGMPVPVGVPGELYVGGVGVARGYHHRPDLTAETFVPDPFSHRVPSGHGTHPGARLYKTGDAARYLPDGVIEFLGRIDQQIKIRGFRIEPGEIEAVLALHPAIVECAVVAREDIPGEQRLVAYVVEQRNKGTKEQMEDSLPGSSELHSYLQELLPDYMIPVAFVALQALPLTPNGKIDRRALPAPDLTDSASERPYRAPSTAYEIGLAELWQALLQVERIGIDDNFFRLGGHSVLAIRLMEQIHKRFEQRLPMAVLFENATIAHLAQRLEQHQPGRWSPLVPIQPHGNKPPLFCVHGLGGSAFNYVNLGRTLERDQPLYGLQALGLEDDQPPHASIEEMATAYLQAIRAHQPQGPYYLSGWSFGGVVAFEIAQQLQRDGEQVALLTLIDSLPPRPAPSADQNEIEHLLELAQMYGIQIEESSVGRGHDFEAAATAVLGQAQIQDPQTWLPIDRLQFLRLARLGSAQLRALNRYRPAVYGGAAILFPSSDNPADPAEQRSEAQRVAWSAYTDVELVITPGSHWTMLHEPNVGTLADHLTRKLAEARTKAS